MRSKLNTNLTAENRSFLNSYFNKLTADTYSSALSRVIKRGIAEKKAKQGESESKEKAFQARLTNVIKAISIDISRPLRQMYDLLDLIDLHAKVFCLPCRYTSPIGKFKAEIVGVHRCFEFNRKYFVFFLEVTIPNYGKTYFLQTTPTFEEETGLEIKHLSGFITSVLGNESKIISKTNDLPILIGKECFVIVENFYDYDEKCIGQILS